MCVYIYHAYQIILGENYLKNVGIMNLDNPVSIHVYKVKIKR